MVTIPRKVTLPVVCGVWIITFLVAGYTCAILPWFLDYYDYYEQNVNGLEYGVAVRLFRRCYPVGIPVGLCVIGYGLHILRLAERRVDQVAWFAMLSVGLAATWFAWTLLVERSFYVLLFPA